MKETLRKFKESRVGHFVQKLMDDEAPNLAALLAWGTLTTLLPLIFGVVAIVGLVIRDPATRDQVYELLIGLLPRQATEVLGTALESAREGGAVGAGIVGLLLLLYNGSRFFGNMTSVFNHAYHVENRGMPKQILISVLMLLAVTTLLVLSTVALGIGGLVDQLPFALPFGTVVARVLSWLVSLASATALFVLVFRVLPNTDQSFKQVLPGALLSTVLFFAILMLFPLYVQYFPPNEAYATFGLFLLFSFWLYMLGFVFVLGAELNAFIQQPERSVALAEATAEARQGQAEYRTGGGAVEAQATGDARRLGGPMIDGPSPQTDGTGRGSPLRGRGQGAVPTGSASSVASAQPRVVKSEGGGVLSSFLGFIGLIVAAVLLRRRSVPVEKATGNAQS